MLRDADFLVLHDPEVDNSTTGSGPVADLTRREARSLRLRFGGGVSAAHPPLFSEVVALIGAQAYPTLLELDLLTSRPLPWPRVEWLARAVEPVRDRVIFNGADWNLRRLSRVDPTLPMG
ncbi:MAG: glycerophosphodiester phosphodiesterase, partial [Chloroflexota bacterium]